MRRMCWILDSLGARTTEIADFRTKEDSTGALQRATGRGHGSLSLIVRGIVGLAMRDLAELLWWTSGSRVIALSRLRLINGVLSSRQ